PPDTPLYQRGETVYFRPLPLDRFSLKPADESLSVQYVLRDSLGTESPIAAGTALAVGADGQAMKLGDGAPVRGVGAGEWAIPPAAGARGDASRRARGARWVRERR